MVKLVVVRELVALARMLRGIPLWATVRVLLANPLYRSHLALLGDVRRLDVLASRAYLSTHLSARDRLLAATFHYGDQLARFTTPFHDRVYRGDGLVLWQRTVDAVDYRLLLQAGNDVLNEGGLSCVATVDGGRVAVVSFSYVDGEAFGLPAGRQIFVGRRQLTHEHDYQAAFNRAFHHSSPARFCLAALAGIAELDGLDRVAAVRALHHPNFKPEHTVSLHRAYDDTWAELGGTPQWGVFHLPVPLAAPPIETVARNKRARARARRALLDDISRSAAEAVAEARLRVEPRAFATNG